MVGLRVWLKAGLWYAYKMKHSTQGPLPPSKVEIRNNILIYTEIYCRLYVHQWNFKMIHFVFISLTCMRVHWKRVKIYFRFFWHYWLKLSKMIWLQCSLLEVNFVKVITLAIGLLNEWFDFGKAISYRRRGDLHYQYKTGQVCRILVESR